MSDEAKKEFEKELALLAYDGVDQVVGSHAMLAYLSEKKSAEVRMDSGIPQLDSYIEGFEGGELIVLSGPTKHGKTSFCQTLTRNMDQQGIVCLWFSFEVPAKQFLEKMNPLPNFMVPMILVDRSLPWLRDRIREAKLKFNARAVFIDHLHFLFNLGRSKNPSLEIGGVVRELKQLAMKENIVIFLLCHLTKIMTDSEPTENDLRDSSFIAQEADSTFMIWRVMDKKTGEFSNTAKLSVRNHRRTGVMGKTVPLIMVRGWLEEKDERYAGL